MSGIPELEGIILAAGKAERAGSFKLGWEIGGKSVICKCVENFLTVCERIIVVTGHEPHRVAQLVEQYPEVKLVHNSAYQDGMFTSVKAGFSATSSERVLLTPGDIPLVRQDVIHKLLSTNVDVAIPSYLKRKGHPVLVSGTVRAAVATEPVTSNLKVVLDRFTPLLVPVACEGILLDIDTVSDYNELKETHERKHP